jgi:hypothetical protein
VYIYIYMWFSLLLALSVWIFYTNSKNHDYDSQLSLLLLPLSLSLDDYHYYDMIYHKIILMNYTYTIIIDILIILLWYLIKHIQRDINIIRYYIMIYHYHYDI